MHEWRDFIAQHSIVEQTLCDDPAHEYAQMDFATCNRYRTCVETIARRTDRTEEEVAQRAVTLAQEALATGEYASVTRESHVGYWLIDAGRDRLLHDLGCRFMRVAAWWTPWRTSTERRWGSRLIQRRPRLTQRRLLM